MHEVLSVPPEFGRSVDWLLDTISFGAGLELLIEYSPFRGGAENPDRRSTGVNVPRYRISFQKTAAWAFVDLSLMLQYFPEYDCPPVVQEVDRDGDHVYIREFSIHKEAHGDNWRRFRLTIGDDVAEVISTSYPQIVRLGSD
jgi:hypothetical protein